MCSNSRTPNSVGTYEKGEKGDSLFLESYLIRRTHAVRWVVKSTTAIALLVGLAGLMIGCQRHTESEPETAEACAKALGLGPDHEPLLAYFWAEWAAPARQMTPIINRLKERGGSPSVKIIEVGEFPNAAEACGVRSIPTLLGIENGAIASALEGIQPEDEVLEFAASLSGEAND